MNRYMNMMMAIGLVSGLFLSLAMGAAQAQQAGQTAGKHEIDKNIKCKKRIAYKEVMPGITDALTAEPAARTAIGWERYDIEEGRAKVIDRQVSCVGFGLVVCTAVVTLCYN